MEQNSPTYKKYIQILKEELIPAMGCTEPISIAYGASYVRDLLEDQPDRLEIEVSGNLIKNAKSVVVPNTNGMCGIAAAAVAGVIAGVTEKKLEVISQVSKEQKKRIKEYLQTKTVHVSLKNTPLTFDYQITAWKGNHSAVVRIANFHTNVVYAAHDKKVFIDRPIKNNAKSGLTDRSVLNVRDILDFANTADLSDLADCLDQQIEYNSAISAEGLSGNYGAGIGKLLLSRNDASLDIRARAAAAAGSDARMNGCEMPVVIVSGSGNQGITASVPVIQYALAQSASKEQLLRALAVADLITIHQKTSIGRLSAFCGAVSAGAGTAAGICYLNGGDYALVSDTIINTLAVSSGIVCDGAKSSCAAKIALAVEAGLTGYQMALNHRRFPAGDGMVASDLETTIQNIGNLAHDGMKETDREILHIMTH